MLSIPAILQIHHHDPLPFILGEEIGSGNQGVVYEDLNNQDKVIKLSIIYDDFGNISLSDRFSKIEKIYQYLISNSHASIVKLFDFKKIYEGSTPIFEWEQKYIVYFSSMEKLSILSENENKIFKTICDALNNDLKLERSLKEIVKEITEWFDVDENKIMNFYNSLSDFKIDNKDLHPRNILKDKENNFKLIDFDLAIIKENN